LSKIDSSIVDTIMVSTSRTKCKQAPTGTAPDPLAALLRQVIARADDPAVRRWLRALAKGKSAQEGRGE
jgi:hypothetical protein